MLAPPSFESFLVSYNLLACTNSPYKLQPGDEKRVIRLFSFYELANQIQ